MQGDIILHYYPTQTMSGVPVMVNRVVLLTGCGIGARQGHSADVWRTESKKWIFSWGSGHQIVLLLRATLSNDFS